MVVLQRPLTRNRVELIDALQAEGIAVVVEIDDDFHAIHPQNPAWRGTNPLRDPDRNRDWLKKACARADLVTVSTPALASRYGSHGRCVILPNYVPRAYTELEPAAPTRRWNDAHSFEDSPGLTTYPVGWSGSTITHPTDLEVLGDSIQRLGHGFHVVGTGVGVQDRLGVEPTFTGWVELENYASALQSIEIGLVPLALLPFNEAKSWLKGLEYAAVGVPFVASPTSPYQQLAERGIGWLAETPDQWVELVGELLADETHRTALARAWRQEIRDNYTIEDHASHWWDAWGLALENAARRERVTVS